MKLAHRLEPRSSCCREGPSGQPRALGKVTQVGLPGGAARLKVLDNAAFELTFEATLWGTIKELREVLALAESGRLSPIPLEFEPLDRINEVYARVKQGGRSTGAW